MFLIALVACRISDRSLSMSNICKSQVDQRRGRGSIEISRNQTFGGFNSRKFLDNELNQDDDTAGHGRVYLLDGEFGSKT